MGVHQRSLAGNADAVEWCTSPGYHNLLAAASYTLVEGPTPSRVGGIYLFSLDDDDNLRELQTLETSGVFDIKWRRPSPELVPCLGQASADGSLRLYTLNGEPPIESRSFSYDDFLCDYPHSSMTDQSFSHL